jgi:hypothetical protein
MSDKRMLIVDAAVAKRIDDNRGDMNVSDFINLLIDGQLKPSIAEAQNNHITKDEFQHFEQGIRDLLRSFLEFFINYGLELGKNSSESELEKLSQKLQAMGFHTKTDHQ